MARFHEMLAHQKGGVTRLAQCSDVARAVNPALADAERAAGNVFREAQRSFESDLEGGQVAVIDSDDIAAGGDGNIPVRGGCALPPARPSGSAPPFRGKREFRVR